MPINKTKLLSFILLIATNIALVLLCPPIVRNNAQSSSIAIIETLSAIIILSLLFIFFISKNPQWSNNFKTMFITSLFILSIFIWTGKYYLDTIKKFTCNCDDELVLIGTELTFPTDKIYTCEQLLRQRGCCANGIWKDDSFLLGERKLREMYFYTHITLLISTLSISQCIFNLNQTKTLIMNLFTKKLKCKRFYEIQSRTIDVTGLKIGIPDKLDFGLGTFKIDANYHEASEKLKTLDLLQYGLCNDINGISDPVKRDVHLQKIIETKTKMLEIIIELNND